MPSSQNDIGLFANVLTERKQEQIDLSDGLIHTLTPPTGLDGVALILVMEAQGGAFRYTAQDGVSPTTTFGMRVPTDGVVMWIPADLNVIEMIRDAADTGKVNVAYYSFARLNEV